MIPKSKLHFIEDYNSIVLAKILDPEIHLLAYKMIVNTMIHDPCNVLNPSTSCMKDDICQKRYPKRFQEITQICDNEYPAYYKRNTNQFVEAKGET